MRTTTPRATLVGTIFYILAFGFLATWASAENEQAGVMAKVKASVAGYISLMPKLQGKVTRHTAISAPKHEETLVTIVKHNASSALRWDHNLDGNGQTLGEAVYCRNKKYAFKIAKRKGGNWFLQKLFLDAPNKIKWGISKTIDEAIIEIVAPQFTAFVPDTPSLAQLFELKQFRVTEPTGRPKGDPKLPTLHFEYTGPMGKNTHTTSGRMTFAPHNNWGQKRLDLACQGPEGTFESVVEFEYEGKLDRFAKPSKHSRSATMVRAGGQVAIIGAIATYDLWLDQTVPDRDFTLSAFGLPEPKGLPGISRRGHPRPRVALENGPRAGETVP